MNKNGFWVHVLRTGSLTNDIISKKLNLFGESSLRSYPKPYFNFLLRGDFIKCKQHSSQGLHTRWSNSLAVFLVMKPLSPASASGEEPRLVDEGSLILQTYHSFQRLKSRTPKKN